MPRAVTPEKARLWFQHEPVRNDRHRQFRICSGVTKIKPGTNASACAIFIKAMDARGNSLHPACRARGGNQIHGVTF